MVYSNFLPVDYESEKIFEKNVNITILPKIKPLTKNLNLNSNFTNGQLIFDQYLIKGYGYSNNVYSLISAFTIAILSDRQFQIFWPTIELYIQKPFPNTFISNSTRNEFINNNSWLYFIFPSGNYGWKRNKTMTEIITRTVGMADKKVIAYARNTAFFF